MTRHDPGLAGYLVAWLVADVVFTLLLPIAMGSDPADYLVGVLVVGYYVAMVSVVVAPVGIAVVHLTCRRVPQQWVHVAVAGLVGFLVVGGFGFAEPDPQTWLMALALGVSTATARAAVVPMVGREPADFAVRRPTG